MQTASENMRPVVRPARPSARAVDMFSCVCLCVCAYVFALRAAQQRDEDRHHHSCNSRYSKMTSGERKEQVRALNFAGARVSKWIVRAPSASRRCAQASPVGTPNGPWVATPTVSCCVVYVCMAVHRCFRVARWLGERSGDEYDRSPIEGDPSARVAIS